VSTLLQTRICAFRGRKEKTKENQSLSELLGLGEKRRSFGN
jgi:hypothetical protein